MANAEPHHFVTSPFRPPFLQSPGQPPIAWPRWLMMFEDWVLATGFPLTATFAPRKAALLRSSLGVEGSRIYYSMSVEANEEYATVVDRMARHFGNPSSIIFNRTQFTRYLQRPGDTVVQFLSTLRELAQKCEFLPAQFDERVRDQFAAGCTNDRIRERLLQEPGNRTLSDLELVALTLERAQQEAPALSAAPVTYVDRSDHRKQSARRPRSSPSTPCGNCGRSGHSSRSMDCPARNRQCDHCGMDGHFRSVCRSAGSLTNKSSPTRNERSKQPSYSRRSRPIPANYVDEGDDDEVADGI
jgi:hypothetical protein